MKNLIRTNNMERKRTPEAAKRQTMNEEGGGGRRMGKSHARK